MQMKHLLVALLVLLALIGTAVAADEVEIRSKVLHADDIYTNTTPAVLTASEWAGFYYDLDKDVSTEVLTVSKGTKTNTFDIEYVTTPKFQEYEYDGWFNDSAAATYFGYAVMGFFAEPYVALGKANVTGDPSNPNAAVSGIKAQNIAKLVIDDDEKYTLKTGATLEMGSGYSIIVDQIDVDGNKAYLKLMKDGKELNSSIVNTNDTASLTSSTWIFNLTVLGEKDMQVMRVHVKDVFQGTESSLVEIDGMWLVDYQNATEIKSDDKYGKFECDVAGPTNLTFTAENVSLSADSDTEIGAGIFIKTEKNFEIADDTVDKFYLFKVYTEPGVYEIRSSVFDYTASTFTFNFENFAAFYYDMDNSVDTETLTGTVTGDKIQEGDLEYTTEPKLVDYEYNWTIGTPAVDEQYYIMGFFGEKYVPFNIVDVDGTVTDLKAEKMAKLVIDDDEKFTLKTGATMELGEGYTIIVDQIDVDGNKAYLKFLKDGKEINSSIVNTNDSTSNWILRQNITNEKNVQVMRIHVKDVFQGTQDSLVEIDGFWLMDFQNATELKSDDKFGILEYDSFASGVLTFTSESNLTLTTDMDKQIANNMYLKTADNDTVTKGYFYVKAEIGNNTTTPPTTPSDGNNTTEPPVTPPTDGNNTTEPPVTPEEPGFFAKYMWYIIGAVVLIIIIAGAAYYFMVYKKQA